jgi:hypothetical protein
MAMAELPDIPDFLKVANRGPLPKEYVARKPPREALQLAPAEKPRACGLAAVARDRGQEEGRAGVEARRPARSAALSLTKDQAPSPMAAPSYCLGSPTMLDSTSSKIGALREVVLALLREHQRDAALPTNARFLYYELVQRRLLSTERTGARRPDQILHDALTDLCEDGRIPWGWIVDETRTVEDYTGYRTIKEGVLAQLPHITLDPWHGQAPLILTESRSLSGVLRHVVLDHRARIAATNGQCGGLLRTDIAPLLQPRGSQHLSRRSRSRRRPDQREHSVRS